MFTVPGRTGHSSGPGGQGLDGARREADAYDEPIQARHEDGQVPPPQPLQWGPRGAGWDALWGALEAPVSAWHEGAGRFAGVRGTSEERVCINTLHVHYCFFI